jgi:hypothetical protein
MAKLMSMLFVAFLALGLAAPVLAGPVDGEVNNAEIPGSVIVFAKFIKGSVEVGGEKLPKSEFNISVTCAAGQVCAEGAGVKLLGRWVCPGDQDPRKKFICKENDFELTTTVKATITFGAVAQNSIPGTVGTTGTTARRSVPAPPCDRGFLILWVVSTADGDAPKAIKNDALLGHAILRHGYKDASAYTGYPIQAVSTLAHGALTDVDGDLRLDFDGKTEYKMVTGQVRTTIQLDREYVAGEPSGNHLARSSAITLLTLDVISNRPNYPTFVDLHWYNKDEVLLSTSHEFICWSQEEITDLDDNLDEFFGDKALLESTEAEKVAIFGVDDTDGPVTLIGLVETIEGGSSLDFDRSNSIKSSYAYGMFNDGRGVETEFEPN